YNRIKSLFSSRRRHTRFSRDWSSDVCSSDLVRQTHGSFLFDVPVWQIDQSAVSLIVPEIGGQFLPVAAPGIDDHRVFFTPLGFQFIHAQPGLFQGIGLVDRLQILHELLLPMAVNVQYIVNRTGNNPVLFLHLYTASHPSTRSGKAGQGYVTTIP